MPVYGQWTEQEIRDFLDKEKPSYQKVQLPFGLSTSGTDRREACDRIFGPSIEGKTVLDVGSCLGYFCLEALRRDARRAVGWEKGAVPVQQARTIAEILGSPAEYHQVDIEQVTPADEGFDLVLCLNVLHHLSNPIAALDKLVRLANETLVLEVASLGARDRRKIGISAGQSRAIKDIPALVYGGQEWYFTPSSLRDLLEYRYRHVFAQLDITNSNKDRLFVVALRRQVKRLVVVAGRSDPDKSALIEELAASSAPELTACIGEGNIGSWPRFKARENLPESSVALEGLVLDYDFPQYPEFDRDICPEFLRRADVTFVTHWSPPAILDKKSAGSTSGGLMQWARSTARDLIPKGLRRWVARSTLGEQVRINKAWNHHLRVRAQEPQEVVKMYRRWLQYADRHCSDNGSSIIVERNGGARVCSRSEWEHAAQKYESPLGVISEPELQYYSKRNHPNL